MLAPFELSTLSTSSEFQVDAKLEELTKGLPDVAIDVLSLAYANITSAGKERESAVISLTRLALRRDMQVLGLPERLVDHSSGQLLQEKNVSVYHAIGHLALLYSICNLGTDSEVSPFLTKIHQTVTILFTSTSPHHAYIRDSAPARKLLVKIMRVCLTHAIALSGSSSALSDDVVNGMLEEGIQQYLEALADKDNPVRMAASKALSMITLKLDASMAAEVVEAVLGSLSENVLLSDPQTGRLMAKTDVAVDRSAGHKRNLSAVDPLRWHGLMLTLGHLLFRKSAPTYQLPDIIEALLLGLEFEQRSNVGTSIGVAVRDGACFGIWALARKYGTSEVADLNISDIAGVTQEDLSRAEGVLQLVASRLVVAACLDPSGNIRRGSSAALQELIGRHPDTIANGIAVVQVVDYLAVARRSRAMMDVAVQVSALNTSYHDSLLAALLDWRGAKAADADSRRWAAKAMRSLCMSVAFTRRASIVASGVKGLSTMKPRNHGTTAGARHGLLLSIAAVIDSGADDEQEERSELAQRIADLDLTDLTGSLHERITADSELVMEGIGVFLTSVTKLATFEKEGDLLVEWLDQSVGVLDKCVVSCEKLQPIEASAKAITAIMTLLLDSRQVRFLEKWLDMETQKRSESTSRGRLAAFAYLYHIEDLDSALRSRILAFLESIVTGADKIETKTSAMESICSLIQKLGLVLGTAAESMSRVIDMGLADYTNDQRGDIGSILRLQSLEAADLLLDHVADDPIHAAIRSTLLPQIVRLAAEKLNKVRHRAWLCLRKQLCHISPDRVIIRGDFEHAADVSSEEYFLQIANLLTIKELRPKLLLGLATSAAGGTEELSRACCSAILQMAEEQDSGNKAVLLSSIMTTLLSELDQLANSDDRDVIPFIDFFAFSIEQELVSDEFLIAEEYQAQLWSTLQKVHHSKASSERIESCIKLYHALLHKDDFRIKSLDKLTRQLLHRYPIVRNAAADVLYSASPQEELISIDWNEPAASNKPFVLHLRKTLGVVKA